MFGGIETVASVTEWAMAELMRNPEELKRVQQELADVVGLNRRLEESDFEKLTYLKCGHCVFTHCSSAPPRDGGGRGDFRLSHPEEVACDDQRVGHWEGQGRVARS